MRATAVTDLQESATPSPACPPAGKRRPRAALSRLPREVYPAHTAIPVPVCTFADSIGGGIGEAPPTPRSGSKASKGAERRYRGVTRHKRTQRCGPGQQLAAVGTGGKWGGGCGGLGVCGSEGCCSTLVTDPTPWQRSPPLPIRPCCAHLACLPAVQPPAVHHPSRFESHIWEMKKQIYLGGFDTEPLAAKAHGGQPPRPLQRLGRASAGLAVCPLGCRAPGGDLGKGLLETSDACLDELLVCSARFPGISQAQPVASFQPPRACTSPRLLTTPSPLLRRPRPRCRCDGPALQGPGPWGGRLRAQLPA